MQVEVLEHAELFSELLKSSLLFGMLTHISSTCLLQLFCVGMAQTLTETRGQAVVRKVNGAGPVRSRGGGGEGA